MKCKYIMSKHTLTIKKARSSSTRSVSTPEPTTRQYIEFKKYIESSESFRNLPEALFFDDLKC